MLTPKGVENLLARIAETGGFTDDMRGDLNRLKDELDEREGVLKKYGERYDGEKEEYEWRARPQPDYGAELQELQERYDNLVRRYNARYFGGPRDDSPDGRTMHHNNSYPSTLVDEEREGTAEGQDGRVSDLFITID